MSNGDLLSVAVAIAAVAFALVLAVLIRVAPRPVQVSSPSPPPAVARHLSVRLVRRPSDGPGFWWRLTAPDDDHPTSVDIFSFRSCTADVLGAWHHDLVEAPLQLDQRVAYLPAGASIRPGDRYQVTVGWTVRCDGATSSRSTSFTVAAEASS